MTRLSPTEHRRRQTLARRADLSRAEQARAAGVDRSVWFRWLRAAGLTSGRPFSRTKADVRLARLDAGRLTAPVSQDHRGLATVRIPGTTLRRLGVGPGDRVRFTWDGIGRRLVVEACRG